MPSVPPIARTDNGERAPTSPLGAAPSSPHDESDEPGFSALLAARLANADLSRVQPPRLNGERLDQWQAQTVPDPAEVLKTLEASRAYAARSPRS